MSSKEGKEKVALKDINLETEIYVHYHKNNYLDYRNKYVHLDENAILGDIKGIYATDVSILKSKMSMLKSLTNKDGENIVSILGLMNDINNNAVNNEIEQMMNQTIPELLRKGLTQTYAVSSAINSNNSQKYLSLLDNYIENIKNIITLLKKTDEDYIKYILDKYKGNNNVIININQLFSDVNGLSLLAINKTAMTSFKSLSNAVDKLEQIRDKIESGDELKKITNFKGKEVSYSSFIYPLHYLFSNILGGIGEGLGASYALQQLNTFMKSLENKNIKISIEGTGTQKSMNNTTKKADYTIAIDEENGTIDFSFGISAKAQLSKSGKKIKTTFETTTLEKLMILINNVEKYIFYNNLYFSINDNVGYLLRRKIAAQNLLNSVTGLSQGENVLFVQYLDGIIGVDELFNTFLTAPVSQYPSISISNLKSVTNRNDYISRRNQLQKLTGELGTDLDPTDKNILAWARSRQIINAFNKLGAQIQYEH